MTKGISTCPHLHLKWLFTLIFTYIKKKAYQHVGTSTTFYCNHHSERCKDNKGSNTHIILTQKAKERKRKEKKRKSLEIWSPIYDWNKSVILTYSRVRMKHTQSQFLHPAYGTSYLLFAHWSWKPVKNCISTKIWSIGMRLISWLENKRSGTHWILFYEMSKSRDSKMP